MWDPKYGIRDPEYENENMKMRERESVLSITLKISYLIFDLIVFFHPDS